MTNEKVTLRDIYDAIGALEAKITNRYDHKIETLEVCVDENTDFRNQLVGKMTVIFFVIGVAVNWICDLFRPNT